MSVIEQFETRIKEIEQAISQTVVNHTKLVSYLEEAKHWYETFKAAEPAVSDAVEAVEAIVESAPVEQAANVASGV